MVFSNKIRKLVKNNTEFMNTNKKFSLTLDELSCLLKEIIKVNKTTKQLSVKIRYINPKLSQNIDYSVFQFTLKCVKKINKRDYMEYLDLCRRKKDAIRDSDDYSLMIKECAISNIEKLNPICRYRSKKNFKKFIIDYIDFLYELIPILLNQLSSQFNFSNDDIAFGYFAFYVDVI